jgi:Arc/MetJ family transcription regulator
MGAVGQFASTDPGPAEYVEYTVERSRQMETVQIVLDKKLLQATDQAARRTKQNRSALVREALREHLRRLEVQAKEQRDREGYSRPPQAQDESHLWEAEAAWPAE